MEACILTDVIEARQDAPRPSTDYGYLNLLSANRVGRAEEFMFVPNPDYVDMTGTISPFFEISQQLWEFEYTFNVYAPRSLDVLKRLEIWQQSQNGQNKIFPFNLRKLDSIVKIPELIDNTWQDRSQTTIRIQGCINTGTETDGSVTVILGRIPISSVEQANLSFSGLGSPTNNTDSLEVIKP